MKSHEEAWAQLVEEAARVDLPKAFRNDLDIHDRDLLRTHEPSCFGWILYECGTQLLLPEHYDVIAGMLRYYQRHVANARFYFWKDGKLEELGNAGEMKMRLLAAHRRLRTCSCCREADFEPGVLTPMPETDFRFCPGCMQLGRQMFSPAVTGVS